MTDSARRAVADDLADLRGAIAWAEDLAVGAGISEDIRYNMQICLEEALANLVLHGRKTADAKDIVLELTFAPPRATVTISDRCEAYDILKAATPPPPSLDDMHEGGQGLRLIRAFTVLLAYDSDDSHNTLTMGFGPPSVSGGGVA